MLTSRMSIFDVGPISIILVHTPTSSYYEQIEFTTKLRHKVMHYYYIEGTFITNQFVTTFLATLRTIIQEPLNISCSKVQILLMGTYIYFFNPNPVPLM